MPAGEPDAASYVCTKKKCGLGQPPRPHLLCVNLTAALPRSVPLPSRRCLTTPVRQRLSAAAAHPRPKTRLHPITRLVAVPPCETVSEEAATPGCPQRFHVSGDLGSSSLGVTSVDPSGLPFANLSARSPSFQIRLASSSGKLPQNQPCAITGSVTFTPAVKTLSRI